MHSAWTYAAAERTTSGRSARASANRRRRHMLAPRVVRTTAEGPNSAAMSDSSTAALQQVASEYAAFATVDMDAELKDIHEAIEEMELRLEEFSSIAGMVQAKGDKCIVENVPQFMALKPHVNNLCKRIDALDGFVNKVNLDLTALEAQLEAAESSLGSDTKFARLNPFSYFKKTGEGATNQIPPQESPQPLQVFKVEDYFKSES